jgi:amino acid adenylation domain-containing protein
MTINSTAMQTNLNVRVLNANADLRLRPYWRERLRGLEFNSYFRHKQSSGTTPGSALFEFPLPAQVTARLAQVAANDMAVHLVLLATLGILIRKYSSLDDVCVFTPAYGREHSADATLPVRMNNFSPLSFSEFLQVLKDNMLSDLRHAGLPLANKLSITDTAPEQIPGVGLVLEGLQQLPEAGRLSFDLLFFCSLDSQQLTVHYDPARFDSRFIGELALLYTGLLRTLLDNSDTPIARIAVIPRDQQETIVHVFNDTFRERGTGETILDLFIRQVQHNAGNIAMRFRDDQLTYGQLDERSNQVAHYLNDNYDVRHKIVAVYLDRSIELLIAIFGILKAGGIYMPLSRTHPADRIRYMLDDSCAMLIITGTEDFTLFPASPCLDVRTCMDAPGRRINLPTPASPAYVIYTSGSTGTPKGVIIGHSSLFNRICWMQDEYRLRSTDVILQKTPLVFDVSIWELFWWAICGAKLILAEPGAEKDPEQLCSVTEREGVTVMHFVPSMFNLLISHLQTTCRIPALKSVRQLFTSGEELKPADADKFLELYPAARLHNLYGPTEATVDVSFYEVRRPVNQSTIPIGKPIDNTTLFILDRDNQLQPVGWPGELCIGGVNLAAGYLNRVDLTAEKFVSGPPDGARLYRTGDLARWLPNGNIEYLGRKDNQVKIRGNRIEPGEIEHVIHSFGGTKNSVVLPRDTHSGPQLVGYLVPEPHFSESALLTWLQARLPEYMIPSYFIHLDEIPVTVNGKVDRARLLMLKRNTDTTGAAPETDSEKALARIWTNVLGIGSVGIHDNFFHIGGDSIVALRLIGAINHELGTSLSVPDLYEHKTIHLLTAFIESAAVREPADQLASIAIEVQQFRNAYLERNPDARIEDVYPMSDVEKSMCFSHRQRPGESLYFKQIMQPVTYVKFDLDRLQQALDMLVDKHPILRTAFDQQALAHIVYNDIRVTIDFRDLSGMEHEGQKATVREYLEQSREHPFAPESAPLWRFIVFRLAKDHHDLLIEHHAAILDGWSMNAFIAELNEAYTILRVNKTAQLPPLSSSYRDFILQELLQNRNQQVRRYWQKELEGFIKLQPFCGNGPKVYRSVRERTSGEMVTLLEQTAVARGTIVKNLLFAAYVYSIKMLSGRSDVLVGLLGFNRPLKEDGDRVIGCFTNILPVRILIPEGITYREFQTIIDRKLQELKKYESISLSEINRTLGAPEYSETHFFDTMFNFVRWRLMERMQLEPMSGISVDRFNFDAFVRKSTSFDANYNLNPERLLHMHEYSSPFMDQETFSRYTNLFNAILEKTIYEPDRIIDPATFACELP